MDTVNHEPEPVTGAIPGPADSPSTPGPEPSASPEPLVPPPPAAAATRSHRGRTVRRFAIAFVFGMLGVLAVAAGALAAFESSNAGRILPGVHVGSVDLSGLTAAEARASLAVAYAGLADGELTLTAGELTRTISFSAVGRRLDVDAVVASAMAIGRSGATIERIAANVRNMVRGVDVAPVATFEDAALGLEIEALAANVTVDAVNAAVALAGEDFVVSSGRDGRAANVDAALRAASILLNDPAAPSSLRVTIPLDVVEPAVTTTEARAARDAAGQIAVDVTLVEGGESWTLQGAAIRGWISFVTTADGGYAPVVAQAGLEAGLTEIAVDVAREPVDASFLVGDGDQVVGVTEGKNGRALDVPGTVATLVSLLEQRSNGLTVSRAPITATILEPDLTTEDATQTAPLMEPISEWTTWFPIGIKNGQGVNIWIPARDIDGYVVMPGQWFDFWKAIGPVTRERGYKDGGAIINGRTEPQGALAGGICSTSTTLFNAAIRAGLEMGARRNHYYYIDRYPIGLDATVFQSGSGSVQTMSFRNDTDQPLLIRSHRWSVGSKGYVKFVIWSVPGARKVDFSDAIIKNVKKASDSVVYTTELAPGVKERIEYPVDGKDVWVTRTVRDAQGVIIHQETYYSHYARITGILRIGIAPEPAPDPTPTPEPSPAP